jgi:hypothetical protein
MIPTRRNSLKVPLSITRFEGSQCFEAGCFEKSFYGFRLRTDPWSFAAEAQSLWTTFMGLTGGSPQAQLQQSCCVIQNEVGLDLLSSPGETARPRALRAYFLPFS